MFWFKKNLPKLVLTPSLGILSWFVYGFIFWTIYISFTKSKLLPKYCEIVEIGVGTKFYEKYIQKYKNLI